MDFPSAVFGAATCMLALLVSSQFTPTTAQTAQQDQTMTATASAPCQMLAPLPWTRLSPLHGEGLRQYHGRVLRLQSTERSGSAVGMCRDRHVQEIGALTLEAAKADFEIELAKVAR
jgi:hypothetical protein